MHPAVDATLEVRISKQFVSEEQSFKLEVAFTAQPGISILFGASGAGKTTLLDCIAGLKTPDSGRIAVGGKTLFDSQARLNLATQQPQDWLRFAGPCTLSPLNR